MERFILIGAIVAMMLLSCSSPVTPDNPYSDLSGNGDNGGGGGNNTNVAGLAQQQPGSWKNLSNGFSRLRLSGSLQIGDMQRPVYGGSLEGAKLAVVAKNPGTRLSVVNVLIADGVAYVLVSQSLLSGSQAYSVRIDRATFLEEIAIGGVGPLGSGVLPNGWKWIQDERNIWVVVLNNSYFAGSS